MLDFVVTDHTAQADMLVLPALSELDHYHHAVVGHLVLPCVAPSVAVSAQPAAVERPAPVALSPAQQAVFRATDWSALAACIEETAGSLQDDSLD